MISNVTDRDPQRWRRHALSPGEGWDFSSWKSFWWSTIKVPSLTSVGYCWTTATIIKYVVLGHSWTLFRLSARSTFNVFPQKCANYVSLLPACHLSTLTENCDCVQWCRRACIGDHPLIPSYILELNDICHALGEICCARTVVTAICPVWSSTSTSGYAS